MGQKSVQKKDQTGSMKVTESVTLSHRSRVSTWMENSKQITERLDETKLTKTSSFTSNGATKKYIEQSTYNNLGNGAKPTITYTTTNSQQAQNSQRPTVGYYSGYLEVVPSSEKNSVAKARQGQNKF